MKLVWNTYGKTAKPYTNNDLQNTLSSYAGKEFSEGFFDNYIYKSGMPNFELLFKNVGVAITANSNEVYFGTYLKARKIGEYPAIDSPAYNAGLTKGDEILQIGAIKLTKTSKLNPILRSYNPRDSTKIIYKRYGEIRETTLKFQKDPSYDFLLFEKAGVQMDKKTEKNRENWLEAKN